MEDKREMNDSNNKENLESKKAVAAIAYILFFIPLLTDKDNAFCRFHANQGLLVALLAVTVYIVGLIIPWFGWFVLWPVGGILCGVLAILGIVNAVNLKEKELPVIGKIKIIK